ncbi:MAG TPA: hypothetical protein VFH17_03265, partial [Coriobacteriia bacterium]|nr:hypothetical protein [Coriobacteriia bacterium]
VAVRLGLLPVPTGPDDALESLQADDERGRRARATLEGLMPAHFPCLFPEVFLRDRPGFDVILGNPPWEKVKIEEHNWWALRYPGIRSMSQRDKNATIARLQVERADLLAEYELELKRTDELRETFVKMMGGRLGSGDTDLYKIFAWRDWDLLREGGRFGIVFPRGVLSGSATAKWRKEILDLGAFRDVTTMVNNAGWVFEGVHPQYSIGLVTVEKAMSDDDREVVLGGPFHSFEGYLSGRDDTLSIVAEEFATWASGAAFPLLPSAKSATVFSKMRKAPRFDAGGDFEFRPVRELDATNDKQFFDFDLDEPKGDMRVLAGASFNIWEPDFGPPYAYAKREEVLAHLQQKRQRQARTASSAFQGMDVSTPETLPCLSPRIVFRDVTRATDTRTTLVCLLPGHVVLVHNSPYLLRRKGTQADEAYLLGVMSSVPFDWYSRRFVETHMTFDLVSAFPVPRPTLDDPLRRRIIEIAARLAAVDERYVDWLVSVEREVGASIGTPTRLDDSERFARIAELDALVSLLFGLTTDDLRIVFETFHRGWDFETRLEAVLANYARWESKAGDLGHLKEEDAS